MKKKELLIGDKSSRSKTLKTKNRTEVATTSTSRTVFDSLETRMSCNGLITFIQSNLSEKQISDIKDIGFEGLLQVKTDKVPGHLAHWLVSCFDPFSSSLMDKKLTVRDEDIHVTTGLPMGGMRVNIASRKEKSDEFVAAVNSWKMQFHGNNKVTNKMILERMIEQRDGGEDFKKNFVVYVVSIMLMGVKGVHASLRVLKCLSNVDLIKQMNWSLFTRENMIESVLQWRKEKENEERGGPKKVYKGPVMVLLFIYLDRVVFKVRTVPRVFPTLSTWTKQAVSSRISLEKKEAGCFGTGFVDCPFLKVEDCKEGKKEGMSVSVVNEGTREDGVEVSNVEKRSKLKSCIENLATSGIGLAQAFDKFNKAVNEAKEEMPKSEAVGQMCSLAESMLDGFNLTPPKKQDGGSQDKGKNFEVGESSKEVNGDTCTVPSTTAALDDFEDPCWEDDVFLDAVVALCKAFSKEPAGEDGNVVEEHVRENEEVVVEGEEDAHANEEAVFEGEEHADENEEAVPVSKFEDSVAVEAENNVVFEDELVEEAENDLIHRKCKRRKIVKDATMPSFSLFSSQEESQEKVVEPSSKKVEKDNASGSNVDEVCRMEEELLEPEKNFDLEASPMQCQRKDKAIIEYSTPTTRRKSRRLSGSPPLSPLDITPLSVVRIVEGGRREPSRRHVTVTNLFKSPFLQRNVDIFADLTQGEKDVADLAFGDCFSESEILFANEDIKLSRHDMKSIMSNERVSTDVINCWCHILNKKEESRAASSPLRLFVETSSNGIRCNYPIIYNELSLMMFPFNLGKPVLVCINFLTSKIEVIHPMKPKSIEYLDIVDTVRSFIEDEMVPKSKKFQSVGVFKVEEYIPKNQSIDGIDSGIHLMRNLEVYAGNRKTFNNGLTGNVRQCNVFKKKLIVKYCHAILTFPDNQMLNQIMLRIKELKTSARNRLAGKSVDYSDDHLLKYVFKATRGDTSKFEIVVNTKWGQVTRMGMATLKPRKWVMDMVIDMYGIYSTVSKPDCLYIPTVSKYCRSESDKSIGGQYIKMSYMPINGKEIQKVFIPLSLDNHWFLCICDFGESRSYILNSLPENSSPSTLYEVLSEVINNVASILANYEGYGHFLDMMFFPHSHVSVPIQNNTFDCGVYVLKWLEVGDDKEQWTRKEIYQGFDSYRNEVALKLLRWEENSRKDF